MYSTYGRVSQRGYGVPLGVQEGLAGVQIFPAWSPKLVRQESFVPAGKFWHCCRAQFPNLAKKAFEVLVPFVIIGVSNRFPW